MTAFSEWAATTGLGLEPWQINLYEDMLAGRRPLVVAPKSRWKRQMMEALIDLQENARLAAALVSYEDGDGAALEQIRAEAVEFTRDLGHFDR